MKEKLHKALSTFIEAMRLFEVSVLLRNSNSNDWESVLLAEFNDYQRMTWNNRKQMLDEGTNASCLIDFDNLSVFFIKFKNALVSENISKGDSNNIITWLGEIHKVRNKEAHHNPLTDDDIDNTFMALKKVAQTLNLTDLVDEIDRLKRRPMATQTATIEAAALQNQSSEQQQQSFSLDDDNAPIPAWFNNVVPHYDIRTGSLDESVFAANLNEVALGTGRQVYTDPVMFFETTYITAGLKDLSNRVVRALNGQETENRVISLQTGFGGGKTHSLITLFHIAKAGKDFASSSVSATILNGTAPEFDHAKVAVFTNNTTDVAQGRTTEDGITIHTIWGELAYQLGGAKGYSVVKDNDEQLIAPTAGLFKKVLDKAVPALILVDELADYCNKAAAKVVGGTTLSDQTISFMQTLTEVVSSTPKSVLIATLPSSYMEVGGDEELAQKILSALEARVIRVGSSVQPVQNEEIYEVIRRRLFESIGDTDIIKKVVDRYRKYYNKHKGELPSYVNNGKYPEIMRKAYPFHPELIETFRNKWGQDSRFQRTRGVLRLLAAIVNDLWKRRQSLVGSQALIHTSDVRLDQVDTLRGTITNLKGSQWESVMTADVIGSSSNAYRIDNEDGTSDLCRYSIAEGVATTVLLSSIAGQHNSEIDADVLKLCMMRPAAYKYAEIDNALSKLESRAFYMYTRNVNKKVYHFEARPNLNILLNQAKAQVTKDAVNAEIVKRLNDQNLAMVSDVKVLINPSSEIPEQKQLTMVILGPKYLSNGKLSADTEALIKSIATSKGTSPRVYRNTIFYMVITEQGYNILADKVRSYLACKAIKDEYTTLDPDQKEDVRRRLAEADRQLLQALINAYTTIVKYSAMEGATVVSVHETCSNFHDYISSRVMPLLKDEELLISSIGQGLLKENNLFPTPEKPVKMKDVYDAFLRFDDKPFLAGPSAVENAVNNLCSHGLIKVGYGEADPFSNIQSNTTISFFGNDYEGIWLLDKDYVDTTATPNPPVPEPQPPTPTTCPVCGNNPCTCGPTPPTTKKYKKVKISGEIPMEQWTYLFPAFVAALKNNGLKIKVEFDAKTMPQSELTETSQLFKSIKESASQLGLQFDTEEE